jgi:hypothetical protein
MISLPDFKNGFQRVIKHMLLLPQLPERPQNERHLTHILFPTSISTGVQYVTLDNKIKCLSLAVFLLATPSKNYNRNCIYVGTTNSKPPGPIIMINQTEILSRSQVQNLLYYFCEVHNVLCPLPATASCTNFGAEKPIF